MLTPPTHTHATPRHATPRHATPRHAGVTSQMQEFIAGKLPPQDQWTEDATDVSITKGKLGIRLDPMSGFLDLSVHFLARFAPIWPLRPVAKLTCDGSRWDPTRFPRLTDSCYDI